MAYTKKTWNNLPNTTTPVNATGMNDLETRIDNGIQLADALSIPSITNNIASNSDLNNFTTEGGYMCQNAATAQTLSNTPYKASAFKLIVMKFHDVSRYAQILIGNGYPMIFIRTYSSAGWGAWRIINNVYPVSEQIVNYWTDGKPIYRKVITGTTPSDSTATAIGTTTSKDNIINLYGTITNGSQRVPMNFVYNTSQNSLYNEGNNIMFRTNASAYQSKSFLAVVEYTKTTD